MIEKSESEMTTEEIKAKYRDKVDNAEFPEWQDVRKALSTSEEIAARDIRVAFILEMVKARQDKGISQKKLEELSGVKQPVIARMENGSAIPNLNTVIKILQPLGKTLTIGDIKQ